MNRSGTGVNHQWEWKGGHDEVPRAIEPYLRQCRRTTTQCP
jgi:hypothetical protein